MTDSERIAVFAEGWFATTNGKAAHGLIRYGERSVVAVIDSSNAGRTSDQVIPYTRKAVPIVATLDEAVAHGATVLAVGVAPMGGKLPPEWKAVLLAALRAGLDVEAGLHDELGSDADLVEAARRSGRQLRDLRAVPRDLSTPTGRVFDLPVTIVHTVGTECAIGKMSAVLELVAAARAAGRRAVFVATGQVGISIAGWGIAVDHVIADYLAGAAERLCIEGATRGDLLFVEGQGAIHQPAYSGVTLGLLHGSAPHALVLAHEFGVTDFDDFPGVTMPPLTETIDLYERLAAPLRPARVCAVALNTRRLADDAAAREAIATVEAETGLPCEDAVRFGPERLWRGVAAAIEGVGA